MVRRTTQGGTGMDRQEPEIKYKSKICRIIEEKVRQIPENSTDWYSTMAPKYLEEALGMDYVPLFKRILLAQEVILNAASDRRRVDTLLATLDDFCEANQADDILFSQKKNWNSLAVTRTSNIDASKTRPIAMSIKMVASLNTFLKAFEPFFS